jgi:YbbR domain-containing protein
MPWSRHIEDYAIVTLITLLIWLYAESRTLETYGPVPFVLELQPTGDDLVITEPTAPKVSVEFTGANSAISRLKANLSGGKLKVPLQLLEPGNHTVPLTELLRQAEKLADASVNITGVSPSTIDVTIARLVTREADVVWQPEGLQLQDGYKSNPATVQITLPEDRLAEVMADGIVSLQLRPREDVKTTKKASVEVKVPADVMLPPLLQGHPYVKLTPPEVELSFIIEKKEEAYTVPSVPVFFTGPPGELREFAVDIHEDDRLLKDVEVVGPADLVEQVRRVAIKAHFSLDRDGLVAGVQKGEAAYPITFLNVPQGLSVRSPKTAVRATIRRLSE